ncbi:MAG TPA: DUF72 domain-containing protein [Chitinispirillaceae bacterium]|nr:DUF72 domain-containing protein [Chitinispirillaceae bacterium]
MNHLSKKPIILLGTSGWSYKHWKGVFYPQEIAMKKWFEYFSRAFNTVEINASFYRIPVLKTVQGWNERSPENFKFSIKMSRLVSHIKKLRNCNDELDWFFSVFEPLYEKIAIILIQLPPTLKFDPGRIIEFSSLLPTKYQFAFEFRNTSWYREETYEILHRFGHIFCIHDMVGMATEKIVTANSAYIRFHGFDSVYGGDYPDSHLLVWADWIKTQLTENRSVYGYFNNDVGGYAVKNCMSLRKMIEKK